jgi:hypothetical protein
MTTGRTLTGRCSSALLFVLFVFGACSSSSSSPAPVAAPTTATSSASSTEDLAPTTVVPQDLESTVAPDEPPMTSRGPADPVEVAGLGGTLLLRNADGDVVTAHPDGTVLNELASGVGRLNSQPTWSSSADHIAYSSLSAEGATLEIVSVAGRSRTSTSLQSPPFYLSWSTDDSWVGALRPITGSIEFVIVDSTTGAARPIGSGQTFYFDWHDDQNLIAAINATTLVAIPAQPSLRPSERTTETPLGRFQTPSGVEVAETEGPDVLLALARGGANDVVLLSPDGSETEYGRANGPVLISTNPIDQQIAVLVTDSEPRSQVISLQTDAPRELPAGRVSIVDRASGEVITRDESRIIAIQWSPDGQRLAMLQAEGGMLRWLVATPDGVRSMTQFAPTAEFASAYLPFSDQYNHSSTWWSPDSRALVMAGTIGSDTGIWVDLIDDDRDALLVSSGDIAVWSPR